MRLGLRPAPTSYQFEAGSSTRGAIITKASILAFALILSGLTLGFVWTPKSVNLVVDGHQTIVATKASSVAGLLAENGIVVAPIGRITPQPFAVIQEGMRVEVRNAIPVTIEADNQTVTILTTASTVRSAIREAGIRLQANDKVTPARGRFIEPNLRIKIAPVFHRIILTKLPLHYKTISKFDPTLYSYASKVETNGKEGVILRLEDVIYEGKKQIKTVLTSERIIVSPVSQVVRMGAGLYQSSVGGRALVSRGSRRGGKVWSMFATTYVPGHGCSLHTATGHRARYGIVAVDPRVIPLGTLLYIEGYGSALAADTGGSIKGNRIDLCFDSEAEARSFSANRTVKVHLVK